MSGACGRRLHSAIKPGGNRLVRRKKAMLSLFDRKESVNVQDSSLHPRPSMLARVPTAS